MSITAANQNETRSWPVTREARERLLEEIAQLQLDLASLTGQGLEEGIVRLPVALAARRLETLRQMRDRTEVISDVTRVAIGRRVVLHDETGEAMSYWVVFPGDGDPAQGWISGDSPLGVAILGAKAGDVAEVNAPVGRWSATVVAVD